MILTIQYSSRKTFWFLLATSLSLCLAYHFFSMECQIQTTDLDINFTTFSVPLRPAPFYNINYAPEAPWSLRHDVQSNGDREVPRVDNKAVPRVDNREIPSVHNEEVPRVDNTEVPSVDNIEGPRVDNREVPRVDNKEVPRVDNKEVPRVDNKEVSRVDNKEVPRVDNKEVPRVHNVSSLGIRVKDNSSSSITFLVSELRKKLIMAEKPEAEVLNITTACKDRNIEYEEPVCQSGQQNCSQKTLPESLEDRIQQLAFRQNLQVPQKYVDVIHDMAAEISGFHDIIIVSAFSSNHFLEAQAMLKDLHETVFPVLKNFTLVIYNIGLREAEKEQMRQFCRCTLFDFPFEKFPEHFRTLKCFSWKVTAIRAMYERANIVIWTDTSIKITNSTVLLEYIVRGRQRGIQQRFRPMATINPYHTLIQMFEHFGDSPCAHMAFHQAETGYGIYHREPLIRHAIIDPWFGCAVRAECICPVKNQRKVQYCSGASGRKIGLCMRNEQSAISIILAKLFREKYRYFMVDVRPFQSVRRGFLYHYFKELRNFSTTNKI